MTKTRQAQSGFTLIELMIAVAVVAILASLAYPGYTSAMVKNRRASAQALLSDAAQRQQQYLLDNRSFAANLSLLHVAVPTDVSNYYTVTFTVGTSTVPSFTATATPLTGTSQARDGALRITNTGVRLPADKW